MTERKTYRATMTRNGRWWAIAIDGLPDAFAGVTQSPIDKELAEAEAMTRECIALLLDVPEDSFDVELAEVQTDRTNEGDSA